MGLGFRVDDADDRLQWWFSLILCSAVALANTVAALLPYKAQVRVFYITCVSRTRPLDADHERT